MQSEGRRPAAEVVTELRATIAAVLDPLIPIREPVALVDFPDHANVGDSAIWLGELAYLAGRQADVVYHCDLKSFHPEALRARIGDGLVLLHGGGNLGTLWPAHQALRERVVELFPNNRIVQFPQTIHFERVEEIRRVGALLRAHGGVTVLARDPKSLRLTQEHFPSASALCPDMAFCLDGIRPSSEASVDILALARTDKEAGPAADRVALALAARGGSLEVVDWLKDGNVVLRRGSRLVKSVLALLPSAYERMGPMLASLWRRLAEARLERGVGLLSRGHVVITDRLHAHILCVLMGQPHVVIDNSYGKVRAYFERWTCEVQNCLWAESLQAGLGAGRELLKAIDGAPPRSRGAA